SSCRIAPLPTANRPLFPYTTLFRSELAHQARRQDLSRLRVGTQPCRLHDRCAEVVAPVSRHLADAQADAQAQGVGHASTIGVHRDRKSTRLNSSHEWISYAVFCLKK